MFFVNVKMRVVAYVYHGAIQEHTMITQNLYFGQVKMSATYLLFLIYPLGNKIIYTL